MGIEEQDSKFEPLKQLGLEVEKFDTSYGSCEYLVKGGTEKLKVLLTSIFDPEQKKTLSVGREITRVIDKEDRDINLFCNIEGIDRMVRIFGGDTTNGIKKVRFTNGGDNWNLEPFGSNLQQASERMLSLGN